MYKILNWSEYETFVTQHILDCKPHNGDKIVYLSGMLHLKGIISSMGVETCFLTLDGYGNPMGVHMTDLVYVIIETIKPRKEWADGLKISKEDYEKVMNPYPKEVMDIVEIMKNFGEWWKDDCGEHHLDDVKMYPCATEIYNIFKPKENEKGKSSQEPNEAFECDSFNEIVRKRGGKGKVYLQSAEENRARRQAKQESAWRRS